MQKIIIRRAKTKDIARILKLNHAMCVDEHQRYDPLIIPDFILSKEGRSYFKERQSDKKSLLIVATLENQVIGYLCAHMKKGESYRGHPLLAELENMAVDDNFRRQGVGKKLVEVYKSWGKENKAIRLRVIASTGNLNANYFYKQMGFIPCDTAHECLP